GGGFDDEALVEAYQAVKPLVTKTAPFKEVPAEVKRATWVKPFLVCEVRFTEWTSDKRLRAPVFLGFRDDIDPEQCQLEESIPQDNSLNSRPLITPITRIEFTNLDKIFWPEDGYTKGDLINYYDKI